MAVSNLTAILFFNEYLYVAYIGKFFLPHRYAPVSYTVFEIIS